MRVRDLIPTLLVVVIAIVAPIVDEPDQCPAGTDGPQFLCWLKENPQ